MGQLLGQPIIVENKPGGGTVVATDALVRAKPDGHTLLVVNPNLSTNPSLVKSLPYKTPDDFAPVSLIIKHPLVLAARADLPANNVKELIDYAKANPGKVSNAVTGMGTGNHLAIELMANIAGVKVLHAPFDPIMTAVAGGHVDLAVGGLSAIQPFVDSKRAKILGNTGLTEMASNPPIPSIAAQGVPGFEYVLWWGIVAPKGTPGPVIAKLNKALVETLADPNVKERLASFYGDARADTPKEFLAFINDETTKWGKIIKDAGIEAQ
jgi:tripartite-type tricarboxylate transporter receptor subunit TctC